jgi:hypothetical protein
LMAVMEELRSSEIQMGITTHNVTCKLDKGNNEGDEVNVELWVHGLGRQCSGASARQWQSLRWCWSPEKREQSARKEK